MKKLTILLVIICLSVRGKAQTATFNITYTGSTPQMEAAFAYATKIWSNKLLSKVPIKVIVHFQPLFPGMLGITFPNGVKDFESAPKKSTWYATSLANAIAGKELNPGETDIEMYLNSNTTWYFDSTGTVPSGAYDLATVAMHELCHGLGFLSLAKADAGIGSFGMLTAGDFSPLTTSFPWPNLGGLPSVFDRFLVNNSGQFLVNDSNATLALLTRFTGNQIYFSGAYALAANAGLKPRIYAPASFQLGSSITHLDEATYLAGTPNELMTPNGTPASSLHDPGPICLGILKDLGWNRDLTGISKVSSPELALAAYPNPVQEHLSLDLNAFNNGAITLSIMDAQGRRLSQTQISQPQDVLQLNVSDLATGIYFINCTAGDTHASCKFIKTQ